MYDHAHALAKSLGESDEFDALKQAYEDVMSEAETKQLFERFRDLQMQINEKQMQGAEITEEEVTSANKVVEEVQADERIAKLLDIEQRLNTIIGELSQIITKPLEDLYELNK